MGKRQGWDFRLRLVAWYTLLSGLTLLVFDAFLYFQFREGLQKQIDQTLEVAALQAINNIDDEHGHGADGADYSQEDAPICKPRRIEGKPAQQLRLPPPNCGESLLSSDFGLMAGLMTYSSGGDDLGMSTTTTTTTTTTNEYDDYDYDDYDDSTVG